MLYSTVDKRVCALGRKKDGAHMAGFLSKLLTLGEGKQMKGYQAVVDKVNGLEPEMQAKSDDELRALTAALRERAAGGEDLKGILPEAFAAVREASVRTLGLRHFDVQLIGGMALNDGQIAEMKTGEGKTLVSTLAGYLNALSGNNVHIVTVNDYLARRDSEWMGRIYRFLGMEVGLIQNGMRPDKRVPAYKADVTYGTNSEFGFDYLRDNMVTRAASRVQRGHHFAIVDEVDSILIDEARTPLIISGAGTQAAETYNKFARVMVGLREGEDFDMDEAKKTINATESGLEKIEAMLGIDDIYADPSGQLANHLQQALKAQFLFHRDVDYVVANGEVKIVDEFTGRIMEGRRWSEGLHQAVEAKERVLVREENQTLATITLQNYFRLYEKLSGMTGTAMTEDAEFRQIYKLPVVAIPPNRPVARKDEDDLIYRTVEAKFNAVADDVAERNAKGQPCLIGTVSIESSEKLSRLLDKRGIKHETLNAKNHEREAHIIAQAGRVGAVTIATNMAGRGTDILLGGNAEVLADDALRARGLDPDRDPAAVPAEGEEDATPAPTDEQRAEALAEAKRVCAEEHDRVIEAGGLAVIGTERHESRRIDNQLRGRSGRQGDPGASRFFLSLEDDLMRLFGGERVQSLMDTLGLDDETPIENKMITNTIEGAQKKLEAQNFSTRKNVLQFDDVMNKQREIIYGQRRQVLNGEDLKETLRTMMKDNIEGSVATFCAGDDSSAWDLAALRRHYLGWLTMDSDLHYEEDQLKSLKREDVSKFLLDRGTLILDGKEKKYGSNIMRELERMCLLRNVDTKWMDHIDAMDQLRQGIYLRSYGQRDPVVEYRLEGFEMFDAMIDNIKEDTVRMLLTIELKIQPQQQAPVVERTQVAKPTGDAATPGKNVKATSSSGPIKVDKIGRNDPCPCGSGLKWKKCTCKEYHPDL